MSAKIENAIKNFLEDPNFVEEDMLSEHSRIKRKKRKKRKKRIYILLVPFIIYSVLNVFHQIGFWHIALVENIPNLLISMVFMLIFIVFLILDKTSK